MCLSSFVNKLSIEILNCSSFSSMCSMGSINFVSTAVSIRLRILSAVALGVVSRESFRVAILVRSLTEGHWLTLKIREFICSTICVLIDSLLAFINIELVGDLSCIMGLW